MQSTSASAKFKLRKVTLIVDSSLPTIATDDVGETRTPWIGVRLFTPFSRRRSTTSILEVRPKLVLDPYKVLLGWKKATLEDNVGRVDNTIIRGIAVLDQFNKDVSLLSLRIWECISPRACCRVLCWKLDYFDGANFGVKKVLFRALKTKGNTCK
ncbi:hypothetical protein HYPSUDRAFT_54465 [Hypholoma sublateritium FD-334 SS-4]|uniref:Uncharacterized protein n=1 Tax=Hypholoma sublateritium (strain FD-334 SS-4) TaxID=945553 RepID=A0A0D2P3P0_HYPSF|nr:hypothetical protein HYPSUDRAFT_54465 [Hypholoma sublateritium FD-334 SS-4]